jgi:hypothetical protein
MYTGPMNGGFQIGESRGDFGGGTVDIAGRLSSRLDDLVKVRGVRCNVASHNATIPGATTDTFFQNVPHLMNRKLWWGVKSPGYQGPVGPPPGGPDNPYGVPGMDIPPGFPEPGGSWPGLPPGRGTGA